MEQAPTQSIGEALLTTSEVSKHLRVSINTVHRLADAGELPSLKVGRLRRFRADDVNAYLERVSQGTTPKPLSSAGAA